MAISAKDVMALRKRTGGGMMECKKALTDSNGDMDAAMVLLRERLGKKMDDRSDREASEGAIAAVQKDGAVAMIELHCETDFTGRNEEFVAAAAKIAELALQGDDGEVSANDAINEIVEQLRITIKENISFARGFKQTAENAGSYVHHDGKKAAIIWGTGDLDDDLLTGICQHLAATLPPSPAALAVDQAGLPQEEVTQKKAGFVAEAEATGKPAEIADMIATGKMRKWVDDFTLMGQIYLRKMDEKKPIRDFLPKDSSITNFVRYELSS
jgi:elongation factor Ts